MKQLFLLGCLVMTGLFANKSFGQAAAPKFAVVSIDEVVQLMPEYKKAMTDLAQYDTALQINYAETVQELNRQDSLFKADSLKLSTVQKTAKREQMRKLFSELQGFEQGYQQQMQQKQEELLGPVAQKANQMIQEVAKSNGFSYVFRKEALLLSPEADDLLPYIKKKLTASTAPAAPVKK